MKMQRTRFPLFQSHLDLAHAYWTSLVKPGDCVVDATSGNGHDALLLARLALSKEKGGALIVIDKQLQALEETKKRLSCELENDIFKLAHFFHQCHSAFPSCISPVSASMIVYNLGYLPKGNKEITTKSETTIKSLEAALPLIRVGGAISITCYPGHAEGKKETEAILEWAKSLSPQQWSCCHHQWMNRYESPGLLLIQSYLES
jgi:hypothetical protein